MELFIDVSTTAINTRREIGNRKISKLGAYRQTMAEYIKLTTDEDVELEADVIQRIMSHGKVIMAPFVVSRDLHLGEGAITVVKTLLKTSSVSGKKMIVNRGLAEIGREILRQHVRCSSALNTWLSRTQTGKRRGRKFCDSSVVRQ